jgi:hypothetical protein
MGQASIFRQVLRLCYTAKMTEAEWVEAVRARGWHHAVSAALDVLEPLGPLGAQVLWIAQPAARWIGGWGEMFGTLATAMEAPGGIERLRQALDAEDTADTDEDEFPNALK